jgi:hypothetical protein
MPQTSGFFILFSSKYCQLFKVPSRSVVACRRPDVRVFLERKFHGIIAYGSDFNLALAWFEEAALCFEGPHNFDDTWPILLKIFHTHYLDHTPTN